MLPLADVEDTLDLLIFPRAHEEMLASRCDGALITSGRPRAREGEEEGEGAGEQVHIARIISIVSCIIEKFRKENIPLSMVEWR